MKNTKSNSAFTLLEILLVVGIIAILAGIVIIAINPGKQLASVRNTQRLSDLKQLNNAITQFYIDKGTYPASTTLSTTTLTEICNTGSVSATTTSVTGNPCGTLTNLSELVPTYIVAIPVDPSGASSTLSFIPTAYANVNGTGYKIMRTPANQIVELAPLSELGNQVTIGSIPSSGCVANSSGTVTYTDSSGLNPRSSPAYFGGYVVHTFTSNGTFTVSSGSCNLQALVVAGGGGGGSGAGGAGGGAGGLLYSNSYLATNGVISVSVGNGGAGGIYSGTLSHGLNGSNSTFGTLTSTGGGGGGGGNGSSDTGNRVGNSGGSGGGAADCYGVGTPGSGIVGQGYAGGTMGHASVGGTGGGGAGALGGNVPASAPWYGGIGGAGVAYSLTGISTYYAGGGAGSIQQPPNIASAGGLGGGGIGAVWGSSSGGNGAPNSGGGGGGGSWASQINAGAGGSGIVVVRYLN